MSNFTIDYGSKVYIFANGGYIGTDKTSGTPVLVTDVAQAQKFTVNPVGTWSTKGQQPRNFAKGKDAVLLYAADLQKYLTINPGQGFVLPAKVEYAIATVTDNGVLTDSSTSLPHEMTEWLIGARTNDGAALCPGSGVILSNAVLNIIAGGPTLTTVAALQVGTGNSLVVAAATASVTFWNVVPVDMNECRGVFGGCSGVDFGSDIGDILKTCVTDTSGGFCEAGGKYFGSRGDCVLRGCRTGFFWFVVIGLPLIVVGLIIWFVIWYYRKKAIERA